MTRPERCHGCLRFSDKLSRCDVLGYTSEIARVLRSGSCRWRRLPEGASQAGFFIDYVQHVHALIRAHVPPGRVVKINHVRSLQGKAITDKSNNQFLSRALRVLVDQHVLLEQGAGYKVIP